jgi:hypothetical protein
MLDDTLRLTLTDSNSTDDATQVCANHVTNTSWDTQSHFTYITSLLFDIAQLSAPPNLAPTNNS